MAMKIYEGRWAIVTGASAGIGAQFAKALAARGANVVLAARRKDRLHSVARDLGNLGARTVVIEADLADPTAPARIVAEARAAGADIDILVNNAGFGLPGHYEDHAWTTHRDFLELMVVSYAHLAHAVLGGMQGRRYGRIINVASLAGLVPGSAGHTMYGATKAFLVSFSQSLAAENRETGVKVSALCPGFTLSEFHDVNGTRGLVSKLPSYMMMQAEPVVDGALAALEKGEAVYVPGAWNKFVAGLMRVLPRPVAENMVARQSAKFRKQSSVR